MDRISSTINKYKMKKAEEGNVLHRVLYKDFQPDKKSVEYLKETLDYLKRSESFLNETGALCSALPLSAISPDGLIGGKGFILPIDAMRGMFSKISMDISSVIDTITDELKNPLYSHLSTVPVGLYNDLEEKSNEQSKDPGVSSRFGLGQTQKEDGDSYIEFPINLERPSDQGGSIDTDLAYRVKGDPDKRYFIGLDIGYTNNGFGISIVHYDPPDVVLDYAVVFVPNKYPFEDTDTLPPDEIADFIANLYSRFNIIAGITDQWEAISFLKLLEDRGITNIVKVGMSRKLNMEMLDAFKERVYRGEFKMPDDAALLQELKNLKQVEVTEKDYKVDIVNEEGSNDLSDAVIRSVWLCEQVVSRAKKMKKQKFENLMNTFSKDDSSDDSDRYGNRGENLERAEGLVEEYLKRRSRKLRKSFSKFASEENLKRRRPEGFSYNAKIAQGIFAVMVLSSKSLLLLYKAIARFSNIPASSISPDGNLGGEGYIKSVEGIRGVLNKSVNDLAKISDTLADEVRNPVYKLDTDSLFDLASRELDDYYEESQGKDLTDIFKGDSYKQNKEEDYKVPDVTPREPKEKEDISQDEKSGYLSQLPKGN